MFTINRLPVKPARAGEMLSLPIRVLFAIPPYIRPEENVPVYNLVAGMNHFLGYSPDWNRRVKVLKPSIWAPAWSDEQLSEFVEPSFAHLGVPPPPDLVEQLRADESTITNAGGHPWRANQTGYEIVHFVGYISMLNGDPALYFGRDFTGEEYRGGILRDRLVAMGTRLLILQVPADHYAPAARLAEVVVGSGGPAVLVAIAGQAQEHDPDHWWNTRLLEEFDPADWGPAAAVNLFSFLSDIYLNIVHNYSLAEMNQRSFYLPEDAVTALLLYGEGGEDMLQVTEWMADLERRARMARRMIYEQQAKLFDLPIRMSQVLHVSQREALAPLIESNRQVVMELVANVAEREDNLRNIQNNIREHESKGALPLIEEAEHVAKLEVAALGLSGQEISDTTLPAGESSASAPISVARIEHMIEQEAQNAPRVLNANFQDPDDESQTLDPRKGIPAGEPCVFLVDVGPVWNRSRTIVHGVKEFPVQALPQDTDGWDVQVVLVSDDFTPRVSAGTIYVPAAGGRSTPYMEGAGRAEKSGPLALHMNAPALPDGGENVVTARARLCLYYENNLLQSGVVKVSVVRSPDVALEEDNTVDIDYRLTGSFNGIQKYRDRPTQFSPSERGEAQPVRVNLTINDDGGGGHRILVKQRDELVPGIVPYNPVGTSDLLFRARQTLKDCFFERDDSGRVIFGGDGSQPLPGLNADGGKSRDQFKLDLFRLADFGRQLYWAAFGKVEAEDDDTSSQEWKKELKRALAQPSVIQAARTKGVPPEYVFPWALIYEHNLEVDTSGWRYCKVIDEEWSEEGVRAGHAGGQCPHNLTPADHENVLCPYGFWGLRHIIEQPITHVRKKNGQYQPFDTNDEIRTPQSAISVAVALTSDTALPASLLKSHLTSLQGNTRIQLIPPGVADDRKKVRSILPDSQLVYFLCHGDFDTSRKEPYIGIGLRDNNILHRVYPQDLNEWADSQTPPNLSTWTKQRPLVFINGCHTCDLEPGQILNFVTTLADIRASGVVGTEVSVLLQVAVKVAEMIINKLTETKPDGKPFSVGEAIHHMRWELLNKGSLLGLAYTSYCLSSLHFASNGN